MATMLYVFNRYATIIALVLPLTTKLLPLVVPDSGVLCHRGHVCHCIYPGTGVDLPGCVRLGSSGKTTLITLPLALHALRVYALSGRKKALSAMTFALSLADFILQLVSPMPSRSCSD